MTDVCGRLREWAARQPERPLLVHGGRTYGYAEFLGRAEAVGRDLRREGVPAAAPVSRSSRGLRRVLRRHDGRLAGRLRRRAAQHQLAGDGRRLAGEEGRRRTQSSALRRCRTRSPGPALRRHARRGGPRGRLGRSRRRAARRRLRRAPPQPPTSSPSSCSPPARRACPRAPARRRAPSPRNAASSPPSPRCKRTTASSSTRRRTLPLPHAHGGGGSLAGEQGFFFGAGLLDQMEALGCTGFGGAPAHLVRVVEALESRASTRCASG